MYQMTNTIVNKNKQKGDRYAGSIARLYEVLRFF